MGTLRNGKFWLGAVLGTVFGGMVLGKVAPQVKAKLPGQ